MIPLRKTLDRHAGETCRIILSTKLLGAGSVAHTIDPPRTLCEVILSFQATSWVIEHSRHKSNAFVVLMMIAHHADHDGCNSWPSLRTLAKEARISEREVRYTLRQLEISGELATIRRPGYSNMFSITGVGTPAKFAPLPRQDYCRTPRHVRAPKQSFNSQLKREKPSISFRKEKTVYEGAKPKTQYMEFVNLRDTRQIPPDMNWEKWKGLTELERKAVKKSTSQRQAG